MNQSSSERLRVRLLGAPSWQTEHGVGDLANKFALMVACVAVNGRQKRDTVVQLLWPDDLDRGRASLRQHIKRLREASGHRFVVQDEVIALAPGVDCDVHNAPDNWPASGAPVQIDFLADIDCPGCPDLQRWLAGQRRHWRQSLAANDMLRRARRLQDSSDLHPALTLAREATDLAPWLAHVWLGSARLHYLAGDSTAAAAALTRAEALQDTGAAADQDLLDLRRTIDRALAAKPACRALPAGLLRPPVLIGREHHWPLMESAWSVRRPFVLHGNAGIGKSRLLFDFVRHHGAGVIVNGCPGDDRAPYATLGTLLHALIDQQALELDPLLERELAVVLRLPGRPPGDAPVDQIALFRAAAGVLSQAADSGVRSVALDRLDNADLASLQAWRWLADGPLRQVLLFACASQPIATGPRRAFVDDWLADSHGPQAIELHDWSLPELGLLLASLDLTGAAGLITAQDLMTQAGGNPQLALFTLQELTLREAAPPRGTSTMQTNARLMLERRIRAVPASAQPLLKLGAVLDSDIDAVGRGLGRSGAEVAAMAAELELHGVMHAGRFVSTMMRDVAVAALAPAAARHWHAVAARLLTPDARVPRARVAAHWEAGEQWDEAAREYRAAGLHAGDAGRLPESRELLQQAARCARAAGDAAGEFSNVADSLLSELHLFKPDDADRLVDRLRALASTDEQRTRVAIAEATIAISRHPRGPQSLAPASRALTLAMAGSAAGLRVDALALQAVALAQAARHAEAIDAGQRALALAELGGQRRQSREIGSHLAYVYYEASRFGDAIAMSSKLLAAHEAAGDHAAAASVEGNLATLLLLSGDPAASLGPAVRAHRRHRSVEPSATSALAVMNRVGIAAALGHQGRFGEAVDMLHESGVCIASGAMTSIRAKVQLTLAHLWLLQGDDERAAAALDADDAGWPAAMQIQRCWALARAAAMRGEEAAPMLRRMAQIHSAHWDAPLAHSPWLEWSRQGDAAAVAAQMEHVQRLYAQAGMPGTARTAALRRIDRLNELDDRQSVDTAARLASALRPELGSGLHPWTYLPEALQIIASALQRSGDTDAATACRCHALRWITEIALPNVPPQWRDSFLQRNAVNRTLLSFVA